MFLSFLAFVAMQPPSADVLVVDGWAVGGLAESKWNGPRSLEAPFNLSLKQVGIGRPEKRSLEAQLAKNDQGLIQVTETSAPGVFFSGKIAYPGAVSEDLRDRAAGLAAVRRYARTRDVAAPQPYLVHVWNVDLLGNGGRQQIVEAVSSPAHLLGREDGWQLVLLRWIENGQERVADLQSSFAIPAARCRVRAIADFDGSGTMQVVTSSEWDYGKNVTVWSFKGQRPSPLVDLSFDQRPVRFSLEPK